jgi:uncharacterized protein
MDQRTVVEATRRWISSVVIGLNLCPFARRVFEGDRIRYAVTEAVDEEGLLRDLARELAALQPPTPSGAETTLLIHPGVLGDFLAYNDFLGVADRLVARLGLRGVLQIASFHPDYRFEGTDPGAVENYTNRSPYPMLHLLREEAISAVATSPDELLRIPQRNAETLRRLGKWQVVEMLRAAEDGLPRQD